MSQFRFYLHVYIYSIITIIIFLTIISFTIHPMNIKNNIRSATYTASANWEIENSEIVQETVDFCRPIGLNKNIIKCVVSQIGKHYNYTIRNQSYINILKVDEFETKGYVCRDIAVAYYAIFTKLGLEVDYVFSKNHVFVNVYNSGNEYLDCIINMKKIVCW